MVTKSRGVLFFAVIFLCAARTLSAAFYDDGRIRLVLDEASARFSLYYMSDVDKKTYEPLFWDRDKKTSFFGVMLNGTEYRMGEAARFRVYLRGTDIKPALVFESPLVQVTAEFSFIRTASSGVSNGIRVDMKMENWGDRTIDIGMRMLVDTNLGEANRPDFRTDLRPIDSELIVTQNDHDQWWLSRNAKYGLMGSVFVDGTDPPSFIHFANWKRLYSAHFKPEYIETRNFNEMPFSIRDSAVCYYLEPQPLEKWETRRWTVLLAADDRYGFAVKKDTAAAAGERIIERIIIPGYIAGKDDAPINNQAVVVQPPGAAAGANPPSERGGRQILLPIGPVRVDLMTLRELIYKVDEYIYFGTAISEEELRGMEMTLMRLHSRYGGMLSPYFRQRYER